MWSNYHGKQTGVQEKNFSTTKVVKKDPQRIGWEEKGSNHVGTHTHRKGYRKEWGYHRLVYSPWEMHNLNDTLSTPDLGSDTRKISPLSWFENHCDLQEDCRNLDSDCEECTHTCLLPGTRQRKQIGTA